MIGGRGLPSSIVGTSREKPVAEPADWFIRGAQAAAVAMALSPWQIARAAPGPGCPPAGCAAATTAPASDPTTPFGPAWRQIGTAGDWQLVVSPAFPLAWPPGPEGPVLVRYAYAMRLRPGLADGAEVASPWARSVAAATGRPSVDILQRRLEPLGTQGVRPLRADELGLALRGNDVAVLLAGSLDPGQEALVRAFTCGWIARNGVVAAAIAPRHPAFAAWLGCVRPRS